MHLCFLCSEYPPLKHGGIGAVTQTLGQRLVAQGHRVSVVGVYSLSNQRVENDHGVQVYRVPGSTIPWSGFIVNGSRLRRALRGICRSSRIDILEGPESSFALVSPKLSAAKVIRMHGGHHFFSVTLGSKPRPWRAWLERRSFSRADHFCAVSQFVANETKRLLRLDKPVEVIPNPVDTERFRPMPEVPVVPGRIAFVGTLCEKKGIRQLAQAMPRIAAAIPHARLLAYGRDYTDPRTGASYLAGLRAALAPEALVRIDFRDHLDNSRLPHELATAEVLVYPSHMEAHPVAWLEAMAMGKPVIAGNTGPAPELVEDGVSGILCNPLDANEIAESVIRVMVDKQFAMRLGLEARKRATQEFSADRLVLKNENLYRRCLRNNVLA